MAAAAPAAGPPRKRRAWILAARPPTLPAAIAPVLVGTAVASISLDLDRGIDWGLFAQVLVAAVLIQIGVNFANDLSDFRRGADTPQRLGPPRAVAQGWLSEREMLAGAGLVFAAAIALGISLTIAAGWPILAAGAASCIAAVAYTGGPWPYGYHGLGDLICFAFFGVVAVMGSGFVQLERLTWELAAAAIPVGCLVTAILVVNNLRDLETDRAAGKRTLAVLLGDRATRIEYAALVAAAFISTAVFAAAGVLPIWSLSALAAAPLGLMLALNMLDAAEYGGPALNPVLKQTAQLHLLAGALLAVGIALG